jgi:diguanylate cyclase (GGDEF)-like protein
LIAYALAPVFQRRFGFPARERQRGGTPSQRDAREALALVGDALAATHDQRALLPVILETMIEATGAVGGRLLADGREVARAGERGEEREALKRELGGEDVGWDGLLVLHPPPGGFSDEARELARWLASQASIALENARLHTVVKEQAVTDALTGLANRRRFIEELAEEVSRAERYGGPLAVVLADLDDFKAVNDRFGHLTGDEVLKAFATVLRERLREADLPARIGGEEFAILLRETDLAGGTELAEQLRSRLAALRLTAPDGRRLSVTASFGISAYPQARSEDQLLPLADAALYRAKALGKNRVVASGSDRVSEGSSADRGIG